MRRVHTVRSRVGQVVLDDVAIGQFDEVREFEGPLDELVLEQELDGDVRGLGGVLERVEHGGLDVVVEGVAVERAALQEHPPGLVAGAAQGFVDDQRGLVHRVLVARQQQLRHVVRHI